MLQAAFMIFFGFILALSLSGCGSTGEAQPPENSAVQSAPMSSVPPDSAAEPSQTPSPEPAEDTALEENAIVEMNVQVGDKTFTATLEQNAAVDALVDMMRDAPVVLQMSDYSGFEKVGSLGTSLPASNSQTTTQAGDIVLYSGNQIVIFYGSNSWSYTRLGKIEDLTGWEDALGRGDVTVTFSVG